MNYDSAYYDKAYTDGGSGGKYHASYKQSPYFPIWDMIIKNWIEPYSVLCDYGCGVGQFAEMVADQQIKTTYFGYDFSPVAINMATKKRIEHSLFFVRDLTSPPHIELTRIMDVFIILETLEHLPDDQDIKLIASIPEGKKIIFSVPNYQGEGHYRVYNEIKEINVRYGHLMEIKEHKTFTMNENGGIITAVTGIRK